MNNRATIIAAVLIAFVVVGGVALALMGQPFWFPVGASTFADSIDFVFYFITILSIFFFVLIVGLMIWFAAKYVRRGHEKATSDVTHNTPLELTWTIIPLILVIAIFYVGMDGYLNLRRAPAGSYEIRVTAQKWSWNFEHRNGASESGVLRVPLGRPVKLLMQSQDVLHALYIPAFRVKQDIVPGRITYLWFEANREGEFDLFCAEYCGTDHSQMRAKVIVQNEAAFEADLLEIATRWKNLPDDKLAEYAATTLYPRCQSCHSLDDTPGIGPSWRETHRLWGKERVFTGGSTAIVDENYLRESMLDPQKHIVMNYPGSMPTVKGQLQEKQLMALQLFIRNLDKFDNQGKLLPGAVPTGSFDGSASTTQPATAPATAPATTPHNGNSNSTGATP